MVKFWSLIKDQQELTDGRPGSRDDGDVVRHGVDKREVGVSETLSKIHLLT